MLKINQTRKGIEINHSSTFFKVHSLHILTNNLLVYLSFLELPILSRLESGKLDFPECRLFHHVPFLSLINSSIAAIQHTSYSIFIKKIKSLPNNE